jgi:hypothetical protein
MGGPEIRAPTVVDRCNSELGINMFVTIIAVTKVKSSDGLGAQEDDR